MLTRENALYQWLTNVLGDVTFTLTPLAGDASFRHYSRLQQGDSTYIVMDAPPEKETITPFINVANTLADHDVRIPKIHAIEEKQGFILLEDFGDQLFLHTLSFDNKDTLYNSAMATLLKIQNCSVEKAALPDFDSSFMLKEISLFREWFLQAYLELELSSEEEHLLREATHWLTTAIMAQPQVFIHRDYHSRNLMVVEHPLGKLSLGVLDFQDAMRGPFTYDLASLLKDCYVQWPREQVIQWMTRFYHSMPFAHGWSLEAFTSAFDLSGLQRHLKVLGIFCRLHLRDRKSGYLRDLPLVMNYVMACLENEPNLQSFYQFLQQRVIHPFAQKGLS